MAITPIGGQVTAPSTALSGPSSQSKFWDYMSLGTSAVGPALTESLIYAGNTKGATISAAATNATFGGASTMAGGTPGYMMNPYATGGQVVPGSSTGYVTTPGGTPGYATDPSGTGNLEGLIADNARAQSYFIGIQQTLGMQSNTFTAMTNIIQTKHQGERSAIQNLRN